MDQKWFGIIGIIVIIGVAIIGGGVLYWRGTLKPEPAPVQTEAGVEKTKSEVGNRLSATPPDTNPTQTVSPSPEISVQQSPVALTEDASNLQQSFISPRERDIYYFKDGDILTVDQNLKRRYRAVDFPDEITKFSFSQDGAILYYLTSKGELWRQRQKEGEMPIGLVMVARDMQEVIQETGGQIKPFPYLKGKVLGFEISPNGEYIVYETLDRHSGCCASDNEIPVGWLNIMKSDGTDKVAMERIPEVWGHIIFISWLPDSTAFLFTSQAMDEATQGRPYRIVGLDGRNPKLYMDFWGPYDEYSITIARGKPRFSADGKKIVYFDDFYGDEIWLVNPDGSGRKKIFDRTKKGGRGIFSSVQWSNDGNTVLIVSGAQIMLIDRTGAKIAELKRLVTFPCAWCTTSGNRYDLGYRSTILSSDSPFVWSTFGIPGREAETETKIIVKEHIKTGERQEYQLDQYRDTSLSISLLFAHGGKLYYSAKNVYDKQSTSVLWVLDEATQKNYRITEGIANVERARDPELFISAYGAVKARTAPGMQFHFVLKKQIGNWAIFSIIPISVDTDNTQLFMEYVNGVWLWRAGPGTAFPDLWEQHPELFE